MALIRVAHISLLALLLSLCVCGPVRAAEIAVRAAVDTDTAYVGESFLLQIQVQGSDSPAEPDISGIDGFTFVSKGGQQNNSQSVTIINGKVNRVSSHGYIFNYAVTPKRAGHLVLPAIAVEVDGKNYFTQPITILAKEPAETDDFKLRIMLAKDRLYVGEPVRMSVTWYIGKDVREFEMLLPLLDDSRFAVYEDPDWQPDPNRGDVIQIPMGTGTVLARKGQGSLDGRDFLTVSFSKILIPSEVGQFVLPRATVACKVLSGYRQNKRRDPFSNFFNDDFFGRDLFNRSREVYETVVVPSNEPDLMVMPLPEKGRPANFNGLVGEYTIAVSAEPTEVKVGDPITVTVQVAGPFAQRVELVPLARQVNGADFKVPGEMAPGVVKGGILKTFTQTVRARHSGVAQLPSLSLPYFNSESGKYEVASSKAITLHVSDNKVVTSQDAEGIGESAGRVKKELKAVMGGINYNYEGKEVLAYEEKAGAMEVNQPLWVIVLAAPPTIFVLFLISYQVRQRRQNNPKRRASLKAYARLCRSLQADISAAMPGLEAYGALAVNLRQYLGDLLEMNPRAITFIDVAPRLAEAGVSQEVLAELNDILEQCEAVRYSGAVGSDVTALSSRIVQCCKAIDSRFKGRK